SEQNPPEQKPSEQSPEKPKNKDTFNLDEFYKVDPAVLKNWIQQYTEYSRNLPWIGIKAAASFGINEQSYEDLLKNGVKVNKDMANKFVGLAYDITSQIWKGLNFSDHIKTDPAWRGLFEVFAGNPIRGYREILEKAQTPDGKMDPRSLLAALQAPATIYLNYYTQNLFNTIFKKVSDIYLDPQQQDVNKKLDSMNKLIKDLGGTLQIKLEDTTRGLDDLVNKIVREISRVNSAEEEIGRKYVTFDYLGGR
ncbi:MAG: hypothetical protein QW524_02725, partial [Candidatus Woesearchaeota archaeon]